MMMLAFKKIFTIFSCRVPVMPLRLLNAKSTSFRRSPLSSRVYRRYIMHHLFILLFRYSNERCYGASYFIFLLEHSLFQLI